MSFADTSMRGSRLNWRFALKGIQKASIASGDCVACAGNCSPNASRTMAGLSSNEWVVRSFALAERGPKAIIACE
jgi:hypothetical protein